MVFGFVHVSGVGSHRGKVNHNRYHVFVHVFRQSNDHRISSIGRVRRACVRDRRVRAAAQQRPERPAEAHGARPELRAAALQAYTLQKRTEQELRDHHTAGDHVQYRIFLPDCVQHDIYRQQVRHGERPAHFVQLSG